MIYTQLTPFQKKRLKKLKKEGRLEMIPPFYNRIREMRSGKKRLEKRLNEWKLFLIHSNQV